MKKNGFWAKIIRDRKKKAAKAAKEQDKKRIKADKEHAAFEAKMEKLREKHRWIDARIKAAKAKKVADANWALKIPDKT
jgi:uncharacterized protein involved in exopolysaccharide biosynthesis